MIKKLTSLLTLFLCFLSIQNTVLAQDKYDAQARYLENMEKIVGLNWMKPTDLGYKSAVVSVSLNKDGTISNVKLLRSSNDDGFDKSALMAVDKASLYGTLTGNKNTLDTDIFISTAFISANVASNAKSPNLDSKNIVDVAYITANNEEYKEDLANKINSNWSPKYLRKSKEAIASVKIGKNGSLDNLEIIKSSRHKRFDREVLDTVSKSVPFAALPEGINADTKNIQLIFQYNKVEGQNKHQVVASLRDLNGYDKYQKQIEDVITNALKDRGKHGDVPLIDRRYFWYKDLIVELNINKDGKLNYAKIKKPSKDMFNFDRKTLTTLQKTSFPPIPGEMGTDNITVNYEIITQRGRKFKDDFLLDYSLYCFTRRIKAFCL